MKRSTLIVCLLALVAAAGCDQPVASVPEQAEPAGAASASSKIQKWTLTYTGDLEGTIGGDELVVTEADRSTKLEGKSTGTAALSVNVLRSVSSNLAQVVLTLADGTKCTAADFRNPSQIDIAEAQPMAYQASLSGSMACGEDKSKKITFEASLNAAL